MKRTGRQFIPASLYFRAGAVLEGCGGEVLSDLFNLGLVAGIFEILVDYGLIHWITNGRLVYLTGNDVILLASPLWMPVAWACVIAELGYPAMRHSEIAQRRAGGPQPSVLIPSCV
jgi:hypothetical protein